MRDKFKWQVEETEICKSWLIITELYSQLIVLKYKKTESAVYKYHSVAFISYFLKKKKKEY